VTAVNSRRTGDGSSGGSTIASASSRKSIIRCAFSDAMSRGR
jgi:hypothetical protein